MSQTRLLQSANFFSSHHRNEGLYFPTNGPFVKLPPPQKKTKKKHTSPVLWFHLKMPIKKGANALPLHMSFFLL